LVYPLILHCNKDALFLAFPLFLLYGIAQMAHEYEKFPERKPLALGISHPAFGVMDKKDKLKRMTFNY